MATKSETRYYSAIHKLLAKEVYREKMHNPYRGGTPDVWYSGKTSDLWVEYKYLAKVPKVAAITMTNLLSPLQQEWLKGRFKEGRNVAVILGSPYGAWVFEDDSWLTPLDPEQLRTRGLSKVEVADYIWSRTMAV